MIGWGKILLFHKTLDSVRLLNRFTFYPCLVIILKTLYHILLNSVLSCSFLELCKHAHWIMLFLPIQFDTRPLHGCFSSCLTPKILCICLPPGCTTTMPVSISGKLLLQPLPYSLTASPAARSNNNPSLTQPAAGPPPHNRQHPHNLATRTTGFLLGPPDFGEAPNWIINCAGECECGIDLLAIINSGASVPQCATAHYSS